MSHRFQSVDKNKSPLWEAFEQKWKQQFKKIPTVESIIFLVGIQESNLIQESYTREEKKDLMHVGVCALLVNDGYFKLDYIDKDNWPHYKKIKELDAMDMEQQERVLQKNILEYFKDL